MFVITVTYAPSAAASDARSEAAGDAVTSSRLSDNADEAAVNRAPRRGSKGWWAIEDWFSALFSTNPQLVE